MGHRANLIIIENRKYALYYTHWGAITITNDLFWGPQHAIDFVRGLRAVDESSWLDDVWAEGGAVIDCDNQQLLLYGGDVLLYDVPLRRVYLGMLRRVWEGWDVRWAYEGIADMADLVDYPRTKVLSNRDNEYEPLDSLAPPLEKEWTDKVGSFCSDNRLRLFPLYGDLEYYLLAGPRLEELGQSSTAVDFVPLDEWLKDEFPEGGFHIDSNTKRLDYWIARDVPELPQKVARLWPGWNVTWHRDEFEFQLDAAAGKLRFPYRSKEALEQQVKTMLLSDCSGDPLAFLETAAKNLPEGTAKVEINPLALRHDQLVLDVAERQSIVDYSLLQ